MLFRSVLLWCVASLALSTLSFKQPTFLAMTLNRVISVNSNLWAAPGPGPHADGNVVVWIGVAVPILSTIIGPVLIFIEWSYGVEIFVSFQEFMLGMINFFFGVPGVQQLLSLPLAIMSPEALSVLGLCAAYEYFAITECILWLTLLLVFPLMLGLMNHCVSSHEW